MARILVWSERLPPLHGGAERMALLLADALRACGHEFELMTSRLGDAPAEDQLHGHPVYRMAIPQTPDARQIDRIAAAFAQARKAIARFQPDVMLLMEPQGLLMVYRAVRAASPALSVYGLRAHLADAWGPDHMIGRTLREADYVISCSDAVLQAARERMPEITSRSTTILNALPPTDVEPSSLPLNAPVFLCLGRFMEQKSFATAVRAFARIAPGYPNARLLLAGDGPQRALLENLAGSLNVREQVDFAGWIAQDEVYSTINRATAVVIPSLYEGLPQVGIQAAQMGRPVLASGVDGLLELVVDGETGILIRPGDDAALAAAMTRLLDDPERTRTLGQAASRRARAVFDWQQYVDRYDALIRRLLSRSD